MTIFRSTYELSLTIGIAISISILVERCTVVAVSTSHQLLELFLNHLLESDSSTLGKKLTFIEVDQSSIYEIEEHCQKE